MSVPSTLLVLTHGGAGASAAHADGCQRAAVVGLSTLLRKGSALDAATAAAVVLEDDDRFNAGTGSNLRLDGRTIQMDAAVATSEGGYGAVGAIERVKNPILVARTVLGSPHALIVGQGATALARRIGHADYDPTTPRARAKLDRALSILRQAGVAPDQEPAAARWQGGVRERLWNFDDGCDTIGAVARAQGGTFAAACSTGGTLLMLRGRVGDSPIYGAGLYAGPAGAVCATGIGEEIIRHLLSRSVYEWIAGGTPVGEACRRGVDLFPGTVDVGLIAVAESGGGAAANRPMPVGRAEASPPAAQGLD